MMSFDYKAATPDGSIVEGTAAGKARGDIVRELYARGFTPIRIAEATVRAERKLRWPLRRRRIKPQHVTAFTRELATLLRAGLPLDRALAILIALEDGGPFSSVISDIRAQIKEGASLAAAVERHPRVFNRFYANLARAGEASGSLELVLERLADHLETSQEMRDSIVSALIYPAILLVAAVSSILVLLGYVVPQFREMFADVEQALPLLTRITIGTGEFLQAYGWIAIVLTVAGIALAPHYLRVPANLYRWHAQLLRLPMAGELILKIEVARFARTLSALLQNGVTLLNALAIVKDTMTNRVLATGIERVVDNLKEGQSLADPLARHTKFPTFAIHMIRVGEESGALQEILAQVASTYDRDSRTTIKRGLALLEPALILVLGFIIAGVIVSILLAILSMNELVV